MDRRDFKPKIRAKMTKKVAFEFYAPLAQQVEVAGCFNGWDPSKTPLKKDGQGKWKGTVALPVGRYEYRYFVDGNWQNEQRPCECIPNDFGTWNCVIEVQ